MVNPFLYKMGCAGISCLVTLPLDIVQTTILTKEKYSFNVKEINVIIFAGLLFSVQNTLYENSKFLNNKILRSGLSGILITPIYMFLEINKFYLRYKKLPMLDFSNKINNFITIITIRETTMYIFLYYLLLQKNIYINIFGALIANTYGTIIRLYSLQLGYPFIQKSFNKYFYIIDILKTSINDYIIFKLLYKI
jgi:hypothetical protein